MTGLLLTPGAAVVLGSYTALNRDIAKRIPAATLAFCTTTVTLPLHWAMGWSEPGPLWRFGISVEAWGSVEYAGLLGTGWWYVSWNIGLRKLDESIT